MRSMPFLLSLALVIVLAAAGAGVYAFDRAHANEIAPGIRVGGVELGGMSPARARAALQRQILAPLSRPIVVRRGERRWRLTAREAHIHADLGAMVDEAVARSRHGDIISRTWRSVRGERVEADLEPTVEYSDRAVIRLLDRVRAAVARAPRDAQVSLSGAASPSARAAPGASCVPPSCTGASMPPSCRRPPGGALRRAPGRWPPR